MDYLKTLGECAKPEGGNGRSSAFADTSAGRCFETRSLQGLELVWCQTCRKTISRAELSEHMDCTVYTEAAQFPVEDMMELTVAGD